MKRFSLILLALILCFSTLPVYAAESNGPVYGDAYIAENEQTLNRFVKENDPVDAADHARLTVKKEVRFSPQADPVNMTYALQYDTGADKVLFSVTPENWLPVSLTMELAPDGKAVFRHAVLAEDQPDPEAKTLSLDRSAVKADTLLRFDDRTESETAWFLRETETLVSWDALLEQCVGLHLYSFGFYELCPGHEPMLATIAQAADDDSGRDFLFCANCRKEMRGTLWGDEYHTAVEQLLVTLLQGMIKEGEPLPEILQKTSELTSPELNGKFEATCSLQLNESRDAVVFRMTNDADDAVCELQLKPGLSATIAFRNIPQENDQPLTLDLKQQRSNFAVPGSKGFLGYVIHNLYGKAYCFPDLMEIWAQILNEACNMRFYQLGFTSYCPSHRYVQYKTDTPVCEGTWSEYYRCNTCRHCYENSHLGSHTFGAPVMTKPATCLENGEQTETCTRCGYSVVNPVIANGAHTWQTVYRQATAKRDGYEREECAVCHTVKQSTVFSRIASVTLSTVSYTYNGKVRRPKVTVKDGDGKIIPSGYYKVTYDKGRKLPGQYSVTVEMDDVAYAGRFIRKFKILPEKATGLSVSGKKLRWNAAETAQKYVVYYRKGKTGSFQKLLATTKTACSLKKLQPGKLYYFKVRTYYRDTLNNVTLLGNPSSAVKTRLK